MINFSLEHIALCYFVFQESNSLHRYLTHPQGLAKECSLAFLNLLSGGSSP